MAQGSEPYQLEWRGSQVRYPRLGADHEKMGKDYLVRGGGGKRIRKFEFGAEADFEQIHDGVIGWRQVMR